MQWMVKEFEGEMGVKELAVPIVQSSYITSAPLRINSRAMSSLPSMQAM